MMMAPQRLVKVCCDLRLGRWMGKIVGFVGGAAAARLCVFGYCSRRVRRSGRIVPWWGVFCWVGGRVLMWWREGWMVVVVVVW